MAGSLVKIDEQIASSDSQINFQQKLTSTYDVYKLIGTDINLSNDSALIYLRVMNDTTVRATSNYDKAGKLLKANTTFGNASGTGNTHWYLDMQLGTATGEVGNFTAYLFYFMNSSEYSFLTMESTFRNHSGVLQGYQGGGVYDSAEENNGISILASAGTISSAKFTLYGLKK